MCSIVESYIKSLGTSFDLYAPCQVNAHPQLHGIVLRSRYAIELYCFMQFSTGDRTQIFPGMDSPDIDPFIGWIIFAVLIHVLHFETFPITR